jgi:hypothetical protein
MDTAETSERYRADQATLLNGNEGGEEKFLSGKF